MPPVVADVTRAVCVCLLDTTMNCAKTDELIDIPSGGGMDFGGAQKARVTWGPDSSRGMDNFEYISRPTVL